MADQLPPNDPLDNRLRATFAAEHADIERRHLANKPTSSPSRSLKWIPFAVAAALVAIAGFAFIGTRNTDQAVELDVAAQPADDQPEDDQDPQPTVTPAPIEAVQVPNLTGENMCGDLYDSALTQVYGRPDGVPAVASPEVSSETTRVISSGTGVVLSGGCTRIRTSAGALQWYEINSTPGQPNDWIRSTYLTRRPRTGPAPATNECGTNVPFMPHFVWGVAADDPDGGLVGHTAARVDETTTRVLHHSQVVNPTPGCVVTDNGSTWYQLFGPIGLDWVNARYLRVGEPACLVGDQSGSTNRDGVHPVIEEFLHTVRTGDQLALLGLHYGVSIDTLMQANPTLDLDVLIAGTVLAVPLASDPLLLTGPIDGWAVPDDGLVAFTPSFDPDPPSTFAAIENSRYRWYPTDGVIVGGSCSDHMVWLETQEVQAQEVQALCGDLRVGPHFVWDVDVTDPDGGLIAHSAAGADEPVTRIIRFDEVVVPTGACALASNGGLWHELSTPAGSSATDWVHSRYLRPAEPTCLPGEQFGTPTRSGELIHVVANGDLLSSIANQYGIAIEELLGSNPQIDPNAIIVGDPILIPGQLAEPLRISGALDGWAASDGNRVAFTFTQTGPYLWYDSEGFNIGRACSVVSDGSDSLDEQRCMRVASPVTNSGGVPLASRPLYAGSVTSSADHFHDIRTESNDTCTRIVITFGENANEATDEVSSTLPAIVLTQDLDFVRITSAGSQLESAFDDPTRIEYDGGIGLLTLSPGFQFAIDLMHRDMEANTRFLSDPARVVIDLFPVEFPTGTSTGPFGERFVLRGPIQQDLTGQGIPLDNDIVVSGFGRPFEAAGLYRIWSVPDDVDADAFLADPPEPLIEEFFPTFGSADAWGRFDVPLPELNPGTYIAVFGELPPTDEIGFYGTGQLFRVADAPTEEPGTWPEAVLLPNVQLPPE